MDYILPMLKKIELRNRAIALRKSGKTYSQILKNIPVAKSTLSIWLKDVGLAKSQKQRITKARLEAGIRGGLAKKNGRIALTQKIYEESAREIGKLSRRELWLIGIALYWAEGSKEKYYRPGIGVAFTNMDPIMIKFFLRWLELIGINKANLSFQIFIHDSQIINKSRIVSYWSSIMGINKSRLTSVYIKKGNINTKRKNVGKEYNGTIKIIVKQSSILLRKIQGWTNGVYKDINNLA